MASSISFKMRQWLMVLIILLFFSPSNGIENTADSKVALKDCLKQKCTRIEHAPKCSSPSSMGETECTFDISTFSQSDVTALFAELDDLSTWLRCDNSNLSKLDFTKTSIGIFVEDGEDEIPIKDYLPTFTIVNNVNLRSIILPIMSDLTPGFFTILNNPRLSRLSIDNINKKLASERIERDLTKTDDPAVRKMIRDNTKLQGYGECDYSSSGNTPLSWPQFRWCRVIPHDVILDLSEFKSGSDPAYILHVNGRLTIKNTNITDLSILPVYFKSKGGEISGNKDLCISFEDEIRMKRLDFKLENNKDSSCRTSCDGGKLSSETIRNLTDCVTLNGGLILDGIDANTAAADFFKTIRVISGPVVITNAKVTVDFKELKEIRLAGGNSPHISLKDCAHPILFPNLTTLDGTGASPMVVLDKARIDIYNYLNRTYSGKIKDLSRERILETTTLSGDIVTLVSPSSTKRKPSTETVTAGSGIVGQPKIAPDEHPDVDKPTDSNPSEKEPVVTNTKVSPAGETDDGAVKNSNLPSQRDPSNSAVEGKSNVLMMMTIVSLVVFLASSATSVGIIIRYSVM